MTPTRRALTLASLFVVAPVSAQSPPSGALRVTVVLVDAASGRTPVARHALLVSDNPPSAPPRRIVTAADGTVQITLRPGSYTVESDRPFVRGGKAYTWTQIVDIVGGRDTVLELTADNAEIDEAPAVVPTAEETIGERTSLAALAQWQPSVVAVWTPTALASGFVIDSRGLVTTSQRVVGSASAVEVQLSPTVKVTGRLVASDPVRRVAILRVAPSVVASVRPVTLPCGPAGSTALEEGEEVVAVGGPLRGQRRLASGRVGRVEATAVLTDLRLDPRDLGGPVFTADGRAVGMASPEDDAEETGRDDVRVVRLEEACEVVREAEQAMKDAAPSATLLPVEPVRPFPPDALRDAGHRRAGAGPYQMASSDFDVAFITPVLVYAAQQRWGQAGGRRQAADPRALDPAQERMRVLTDFGTWSDYVADVPPVLLVRATPRLVEGFWKMVARGAAYTQGVSLPPLKSFKPGFSRMRVFCGAAEVTPIHAFAIERRMSERDAIREGLLVFDPAALGPACGTVKLVLFSEKEPEKGDTRVVAPGVLQEVWQDFAPLRALEP